MKQLIMLVAFLSIGFAASAQSASTPAIDTNTNTEVVTMPGPDKYLAGAFGNFSVQPVITKVSGTAAGYVVLQSTVDGTNWGTLECPCDFNGVRSTTDSVTLTNVTTNSPQWHCTGVSARRVRAVIATSGTMVLQDKVYFIKQ